MLIYIYNVFDILLAAHLACNLLSLNQRELKKSRTYTAVAVNINDGQYRGH